MSERITPLVRYFLDRSSEAELRMIGRAMDRDLPLDWEGAERTANMIKSRERPKSRLTESRQIANVFAEQTPVLVDRDALVRQGLRIRRI